MKKTISFIMVPIIIAAMIGGTPLYASAEGPEVNAAGAVLMEESTGEVICAQNPDVKRSPASITKIMTLILVFEAIEKGKISPEDEVMTSAYAKSMGGSQVFLEEGELQSVDTLIKCVTVASGNDASVALAEHVSGSETEFVAEMNRKASEIGMKNTHFMDCTGLSDSDEHYTKPYDVALMSRYLIMNYPEIYDYSTIWMEDIVHDVNGKQTPFTLSSTNKLLKQYPYTTGLKTGSTDKALYCISATAKKDGMSLIAVVLGAPDPVTRFETAKNLLHYGFANVRFYRDETPVSLEELPVKGSIKQSVKITAEEPFVYLDTLGIDFGNIQRSEVYAEELKAPIALHSVLGEVVYEYDGRELGRNKIIAVEEVEKAGYFDCVVRLFSEILL